jgi:hypothetical protein
MRIGIAAAALALLTSTSACGGARPSAPVADAPDGWPAVAAASLDAATVEDVMGSPDGTEVRVRAFLAAVKLPCPLCNVGTNRPAREEVAGHTSRPRGPAAPGCLPCPDPAATLSDDSPSAPGFQGSTRPRLRAVGAAGGLQPRHVGRSFLFVGVLHKTAEGGPELDVTDVRALP